MNKKISGFVFVIFCTVLLFFGCKKDVTTLKIRIQDFSCSTKVHMSDNYPVWDNGDFVMINGENAIVNISGSAVTVSVPTSNMYVAVYPYEYVNNMAGTDVTLNIPRVQPYEEVGGQQVVRNPMTAFINSSTNLLNFKNIGAILAVTIDNDISSLANFIIDSIVAKSFGNAAALWGTASVNAAESTPNMIMTEDAESHSSIVLARVVEGNRESLNLNLTSTQKVYLCIPPIPSNVNNRFSISIFGHSGSTHYKYTKTQGNNYAGNIFRNQLAELTLTLSSAEATRIDEPAIPEGALSGVFSVSPTQKVYFSKGNLQKRGSQWVFAENQTDIIGSGNRYNNSDSQPWDLFTATTDFSRINNGNQSNPWRLLSKAEWEYLLGLSANSRNNPQQSLCYQFATINNREGILIFPDGFVNSANSNITSIPDGCAFLPITGTIGSDNSYTNLTFGNYWTSTTPNTFYYYYLKFKEANQPPIILELEQNYSNKRAFRLVQNVPSNSK